MRQIISLKYSKTWTTGDSTYIYSIQVPPGEMVHVKSCTGYSEQREASDDIVLGYTDGGEHVVVTAMASLATQYGVTAVRDFWVGEGDRIFANFPDVDSTDVIQLHINGVRMTKAEFEAGME